MPIDATLASWLTLSQISGLGNESIRKLLLTFGTPDNVFQASSSHLNTIVKPSVTQKITLGINHEIVSKTESWLSDPLNHILCIGDVTYPQSLLNISDPPLLLFVKGNLALLNTPALAIVGSRNATPQGLRNAEAFAQSLSDSSLSIVSGMAHGIDTAAHIGGLRGKSSSIAIVGTGLDKVYPSSNRDLAHQLSQEGAIVSEFLLGTPPMPANFPRRNRIISGLSLGCLVVEASLQSGSLITARMSLEQGRDVFSIPGSIHSPQSKGCHYLIKQGAKLVENSQDILDEIGHLYLFDNTAISAHTDHFLFEFLQFDPIDLGTLSERCGLTISSLSAILLQMELEGLIATLPGGLYQRIV
jgi:DNA processing protein